MDLSKERTDTEPGSSLRRLIRRFQTSLNGIHAVAVVSGDGLPLASQLDESTDPDRFGAMCASLLALASQAADEVARGTLRQVLVEGAEGTMLLVQAGPENVLAVAASPEVNIGRIFVEARKTAEATAAIIDRYS